MICSCNTYLTQLPAITVYMNCDTRLAINLQLFDLSDKDEFIFTIKNYDYIDSDYVYLYRAKKSDIDKNGEIIFKITPEVSKRIKPGAFYNFSLMLNAFDRRLPTEYKKITDNGSIHIEYGAQDLLVKPDDTEIEYDKTESARLELISDETTENAQSSYSRSRIIGLRVEEVKHV